MTGRAIRTVVVLVGAILACSGSAGAAGPPKALEEWPCDLPLATSIEPQSLWPGLAEPLPPAGAWEDDPGARELVDFLTAGENSPARGQRRIESVAAASGPFERPFALLVLSGLVERGDRMREILLGGIRNEVIRSHVLAETIDRQNRELAAAESGGGAPDPSPDAIRQARFWNVRALDDADDAARQLCHRFGYDESKLKQVAATLRAHAK